MNIEKQIEFDKIKEIWAGLAVSAAYGEEAVNYYSFQTPEHDMIKTNNVKIIKAKKGKQNTSLNTKYKIGDSVMVYPEKKIGINHKRVKLHVAATELYPEDYDFSIIFETVENRKKRHEMQRKYTDVVIETEEN